MRAINFDSVQEAQEYKRPTPGGYIIGIVGVEDYPDKEYLRFEFDIAEGEFKNHYRKMRDDMDMKEWPYAATFIRSYNETALPFFKAFKTAVEQSNPGFKFGTDEKQLIRKTIGAVFGEEEYVSNAGEIKTKVTPQMFRSVSAIRSGEFEIPKKKAARNVPKSSAVDDAGFTDINPDDIPF